MRLTDPGCRVSQHFAKPDPSRRYQAINGRKIGAAADQILTWSRLMSFHGFDGLTQSIGYVASTLVLTTFCFSNPLWLRLFALLSNVAFIAFGYLGSVHPVMLLHMILVPINGFHLAGLLLARSADMRPRADQSTAQSFSP
jgi:hypothetical protein